MAVKIYVEPDDTWDFFDDNLYRLKEEMVLIAENEETEYSVFITENNGNPLFSVCKGDAAPEYEAESSDEIDCVNTAEVLYMQYLYPVVVVDGHSIQLDDIDDESATRRQELEDGQYEREDELTMALCEFLEIVLQGDFCFEESCDLKMVEDTLDYILKYLTKNWNFSIYRPMFIDDGNGGEVYSEFPYDEFNFSEE